MRAARVWVARALALVACCAILMLVGIPGYEPASGPVWGRVSLKGRPLSGGAIAFFPTDEGQNQAIMVPIERDGSYSIDSSWSRSGPGKARYRICIFPDPWKGKPRPEARREDRRGENRLATLIRASFATGSKSRAPQNLEEDLALAVPKRVSNLLTTDLEVALGREPTRVDVDLKD